jgi:hypothetical protein
VKSGRLVDTTAEAVAENFLGEAVFNAVLSRIQDARERTLFFGHVALGLPVSAVARAFGFDPKAAEETVKELLSKLGTDKALRDQLSNIQRAGRPEHYLILAEKLNLQDWLCVQCGRPMVQPKVGRRRKTCSDSCRVALYLADGGGWKDAKEWNATGTWKPNQAASPAEEMRRRAPLSFTAQEDAAVRSALHLIVDANPYGPYVSREFIARNKALLLLGFNCPVQLSPRDLATLTLGDISRTGRDLEIRLHWANGKNAMRQYVTVPSDGDPGLCPVRAMETWRSTLSRARCHSGPLFQRMTYWDVPRAGGPSMGSRAVTSVINNTISEARLPPKALSETALLPTFLREIIARTKIIQEA